MSDYTPSLGAKLGDRVKYYSENPDDAFRPVPRLAFVVRPAPEGCACRLIVFDASGRTMTVDALGSPEPRVGYFTPFDA